MNLADGYLSLAALIAAKTTLLLLVAFALSFFARKTSASARHVLWALTFVFLLLIPGMAYLSFLQQRMSIPIAVLSSGPEVAPVTPATPRTLRTSVPGPGPWNAETLSTSNALSLLAGSVWALGTLFLVSRLALGFASSRRVRAGAEPILEPAWIDLLDEARERLGVRRPVALGRSDRVQLPMTLGLARPAILLPRAADRYSTSRRLAVILHELAHVRRRDCGSQLVSQLAAAVLWWNPLVWIACRHMRLLSERASDDLVLDAGARPSDYAHDLLELARGLHQERATSLVSVTMAHRSRFEERLLAILDPRVARKAVSSRFVLLSGLGAAPAVLSLALAVPAPSSRTTRPISVQAESAPPVQEEPEGPARAQEPQQPQEPQEAQEAQEAQEPQEPELPRSAEEQKAREIAKAALASALEDKEASVREQALQALVHLGDDSVAPYLEKALADESPSARAQAAWGLGQLQREDAVPELVTALQDVEEEVREQAAWALGMIGSGRSVEGLLAALSDESPEVRAQSAWALGMIRDSRAVEALSRALKDEDAEVRELAAWALGHIALEGSSDAAIGPEPDALRLSRGAVL